MSNTTVRDNTPNGTEHTALEHVDPRDLLVDVNVRADARLDKDFLASVRALGVLVPIVAVRTADGPLRVRLGHRRTLAAIEGERPTVPVVIAGDEATDTTGTIERLVTQYAENQHRAGLTLTERVDVASQLSLLGVSAAQITKRTRIPRKHVDAALSVAASELAKAAVDRYDFLDLDQAAVVAEFENDPETVKALVVAARDGRFDHVAQRARDERDAAQRRDTFTQQVRETGIPVVDTPTPTGPSRALTTLTTPSGDPLTVDNHADCPGHAAYIKNTWGYIDATTGEPIDPDDDANDSEGDSTDEDEDPDAAPTTVWGQYLAVAYACTDFAAHGHQPPAPITYAHHRPKMADLTPKQQEKARAERRDVIESNKAWRSAETVRRDWLRGFLTRKTAPKGSAALIATTLAQFNIGGTDLAADLLGCKTTGYSTGALVDLISKASEARAQVITLAQVLAAYEDATHINSWRSVDPGTRRYLEFIAANGYTLADVERRACGQDPAPSPDQPT